MTTRTFRSIRAFTIIEALVTVLIVTAASIGGIEMTAFVRTQNVMEQERSRAHQIVTSEMERIRNQLYTHITGGSTVTVWDNGTPDDTTDDTIGTLDVVVHDPAGHLLTAAPVPAIAVKVEVTLTWHPRGRRHDSTFRETAMTWIAP
ncbi:type II secretion system GspH family protein [bacterium]|nr:type II secretion system GspH family protein [bacterium]